MSDAPSHAGPYRLISYLASGGMGIVYLAEREDGGEPPRAAVKLMRRGIDPDQARRFTAERQILDTLQHPNIARLIDAGVTDDHRPYLVMEYVSGLPIDRYCDHHRLSIRHRVALFRNVVRAVAHAHHNLVVHRDLKPSNIFVTHIGVVKLLDFGIAKLVELDPERTTQMTGPGVRLMTPAYASPEQVTGGYITTATDVYVLGLLLFELLTGKRAQEAEGLSIPEVERVVVRTEVARPSEVVEARQADQGGAAPDRADARGTTPGRLRRMLRGDLDRIVGVATRKDPERRYASADALAADLDRYLAGRPILAREESAPYRIGKFVRRRWPVVAAAAVFLVLLAIYAVTVTIQARQVAAERDRAREAQATAEEVTAYLVRMFQASDPSETRGDTITAKELLATGVARADTLSGQPLTQAQLLDVIGRVYQSLGRFDEARPLLERALATRRKVLGRRNARPMPRWVRRRAPETVRTARRWRPSSTSAGWAPSHIRSPTSQSPRRSVEERRDGPAARVRRGHAEPLRHRGADVGEADRLAGSRGAAGGRGSRPRPIESPASRRSLRRAAGAACAGGRPGSSPRSARRSATAARRR